MSEEQSAASPNEAIILSLDASSKALHKRRFPEVNAAVDALKAHYAKHGLPVGCRMAKFGARVSPMGNALGILTGQFNGFARELVVVRTVAGWLVEPEPAPRAQVLVNVQGRGIA